MALNELQIDKALQKDGAASDRLDQLQSRRQWYKSDGTPVFPPDKLGPGDMYHFQLYISKGWSLSPPIVGPVAPRRFEPAHEEIPEMQLTIPPIIRIADFIKIPTIAGE